jgi:signal peptidase I
MIQELIEKGNVVSFSTWGTSMHPLLKTGAIIDVKKVEEKRIRLGDVVLIKGAGISNGKFVLHRVIRRRKDANGVKLVTKGDSSPCDVVQPSERVECLGRLTGMTYRGIEYDLEKWFWPFINVGVALLSSFCVLCRRSFLFSAEERPYGDQKWPQKAAILAIRGLIYPAKWLSVRKPRVTDRLS